MHVDNRNRGQLEKSIGFVSRSARLVREHKEQTQEPYLFRSRFPDIPEITFDSDALLRGLMIAHQSLKKDSQKAGNTPLDLAEIRLKQDISATRDKITKGGQRFLSRILDGISQSILAGLDEQIKNE